MAKNRCYQNKTGLPANREHQTAYKERAKKQAFGVYRPLTDESKAGVTKALTAAKPEVERHLTEIRGSASVAGLVMRKEFGVTFLMQDRVRKAMRFGLLERGFALGRMIEGVEQHSNKAVSLEIPIDGFGWYDEDRTMVSRLAASAGLQELFDEVPIVEDLLRLSKASGLQVSRPHHVELFEYGVVGDSKGLSRGQRQQVSGIIGEHFAQENITALVLGGLVLGDNYSQPRVAA